MSNARRFGYRPVQFGLELSNLAYHASGYATVVLAGSLEDRFIGEPGDVLLHGAFDCHANRALPRAHLLFCACHGANLLEGQFRVPDPDNLAILAERAAEAAAAQLRKR